MTIYEVFMLGGGIALFLYGMHIMGDGLEKVAGDRLRNWLSRLTSKRIFAILVGLFATALVQSSSAVTVMVVGFVNASLMTIQQAIGVIMGSSIGTTMTGILVSLKLDQIAPLLVVIGVITQIFIKNKKAQRTGLVVLGFGILFMGLGIMSDSLKPLGQTEWFTNLIVSMQNPFLGLLVGILLTCVIQSSSAFSGILIALAFQNMITLDAAVYMIIGSNIGTCITALLASIGTSRNAKMAAIMHLVYKIIGAAIFIVFLQILPITDWIKGYTPEAQWQVATFNTVYNVINCVLLFPFAGYIVKLTERIVPKRKVEEDEEEYCLKYMDSISANTPQLFVPQALKEVERMELISEKNVKLALHAFRLKSGAKAEKLFRRENVIDYLNHEITASLSHASSMDLPDRDRMIIGELYRVLHDIERIGDHAKNIMEYAEMVEERNIPISDTALESLDALGQRAVDVLDLCWQSYLRRDLSRSAEAEAMEARVDRLTDKLKNEHIDRLNKGQCDASASMVFNDMLTDLERISDHAIGMLHTMENSIASAKL